MNGRELFYQTETAMMAVPVLDAQTLRIGLPTRLFAFPRVRIWLGREYDVSPDGQRFLMLEKPQGSRAASELNLVLNWFEELRRIVPAIRK